MTFNWLKVLAPFSYHTEGLVKTEVVSIVHENRYVEIHQCLVVVNLWSQKDGRVTLYPDVVTVVTTILDVRLYIQFLTYAKKHAT